MVKGERFVARDLSFLGLLSSAADLEGRLLQTEFALLKAETSENAGALARVIALAVAAGISGVMGMIFAFISLAFVLIRLGLEPWAAWAIIALVCFIVAASCAMIARHRLKSLSLLPSRTMAQLKEDVLAFRREFIHV